MKKAILILTMLQAVGLTALPFVKDKKHESALEISKKTKDSFAQATPQNSVFMFDLHGVVITKSKSKIELAFLSWKMAKWKTLSSLVLRPITVLCVAKDIYKMQRENKKCGQQYFDEIANKYPQLGLNLDDLYDYDTIHSLNPKTVECIRQLKAKGFQTGVFTNMGDKAYEQKLLTRFPELKYLLGTKGYNPNAACNYASKPNPESCDCFLNKLKNDFGQKSFNGKLQNVYFIDDRPKNIIEAIKHNPIRPYYFTSAEQFEKNIKKIK
ncbi:MAG: hypothetical protein UR26_C0001G0205 [candidate division TM6 bacterium GW2011_GWF2_32_72]|nr:MAG: hypothetical protein UR26_C0001G0205 [candidate division TM6 bacterium GW2011_GWF2_32_72]